jgi:hypothetical protein
MLCPCHTHSILTLDADMSLSHTFYPYLWCCTVCVTHIFSLPLMLLGPSHTHSILILNAALSMAHTFHLYPWCCYHHILLLSYLPLVIHSQLSGHTNPTNGCFSLSLLPLWASLSIPANVIVIKVNAQYQAAYHSRHMNPRSALLCLLPLMSKSVSTSQCIYNPSQYSLTGWSYGTLHAILFTLALTLPWLPYNEFLNNYVRQGSFELWYPRCSKCSNYRLVLVKIVSR